MSMQSEIYVYEALETSYKADALSMSISCKAKNKVFSSLEFLTFFIEKELCFRCYAPRLLFIVYRAAINERVSEAIECTNHPTLCCL